MSAGARSARESHRAAFAWRIYGTNGGNDTSMSQQHAVRMGPIRVGAAIDARELTTISGARIRIPDGERIVHFQFRRFAGCPVCNLHLRSVVRRREEIVSAGIREVIVFHSTREDLLQHQSELPFAVIADPAKRLYREFGVESSPRSLLDPRVWGAIVRGVVSSALAVVRRREPLPPLNPRGGSFGLPADFLIATDGRVLACRYGIHADDQWSVDELLGHARGVGEPFTGDDRAPALPAARASLAGAASLDLQHQLR